MRVGSRHVRLRIKVWLLGVILFGCLAIADIRGNENGIISCFTDKPIYQQGENIIVTIINQSRREILLADRECIDAGFATIEKQGEAGKWQAIEFYAAANVLVFKALPPGASRSYTWKTIGYNRSTTVAPPGHYRVIFANAIRSNPFEIIKKFQP